MERIHIESPKSSSRGGSAELDLAQENAELRERLAKFTEASLYATQSLDLTTVLENCLQAACTLTGAQHGAIVSVNDAGVTEHAVTVGISPDLKDSWKSLPKMREFYSHLNGLTAPLRLADFPGYASSLGFPGEHLSVCTFLGMPVEFRGSRVGSIYLADKEGERKFTPSDEETLVTFASQAAAAIANARRYEEEQRAKADLEALINISPVGVLVFDALNAELVSLNQEAKKLVGDFSPQDRDLRQIIGRFTIRRASGQEFSLDIPSLLEQLKSGETVRAEEMTLTLPDGSTVSALVNAVPIRSDGGEVTSVVVTLQDMAPLEDLDRLRAQFLVTIGNELRTPLSAIKGSVASLLDPIAPLNPTESSYLLHIIDDQADLMRSQLNGLIELTQIEAGLLAVQTKSVNVAALVDEAIDQHQGLKGRFAIERAIPAALPQIMADKERLNQVVQNLLNHAHRYCTDTTAIRISASRDDIFVAISISTNGFGVPGTGLSYLFRRLSPSGPDFTRQAFNGDGLDLAICKGIVEAHGGRIWAGFGAGGRGMSFTFTIPVADEPATLTSNDSFLSGAPFSSPSKERIRVLVAVDDAAALRSVRNSLFGAGYTPISTFDLDDVERLLNVDRPDVLLLDLSTAGVRGYDLMRRVSTEYGIPVVVLSRQDSDDHIVRAFEMGAADYIVKPFSPSELVARIKASLRKRGNPHRAEYLESYQVDGLNVDFAARSVIVQGNPVKLTPTEFKLLSELSTSAGRVLTQNELLQRVWGPEYSGESQLLRAYVKSLRQKLGDDARNPKYIFTEHGVGYCVPKP